MIKKFLALLVLLGGLGQIFGQPFVHPGIPLRLDDLNYVKARLAVQPWKSGWDALQADGQASTNYVMGGPLGLISRTPNINLPIWRGDITAVYKLALRWYYSGDTNYAIKATAIFDAWATTMTNFGGSEAYLDIGNYVAPMIGGVEILRGTYPGWTALNTQHATNYFENVIRPPIGGGPPLPVRGANQGMTQIKSMLAIAVFCDDTNSWNQCLFAYRNDGDGILDTSPLGMVGDTGRDAGHWADQFLHYAWTSAVAWAQGVDLFSEQNNRLATCAEYFSRFDQANYTPFVTFGSIYGLYPAATFIQPTSTGGDLAYRTIIQTAYETRQGMTLPWTDLMTTVWGDDVGFEFLRLADTSTATYAPLTPLTPPAAYTNWTDTDIGGPGVAPFTPTSLVATAGKSQAMLSWTTGAGATYCNVKRAASSGGPYTTIASNYPAATYTDGDLTNGTTYYYVVSGTNAVGESSNSIFASVTPNTTAAVPAAPGGLTVFAYDSAADLSWTAVTNAISYDIKRSTSPSGPFTRLFYGTGRLIPGFTDTTVTNGVTYYYVVAAVNYFGESTNQVTAVSGTPQQALVWTGTANTN
jgi:hypothetical protein